MLSQRPHLNFSLCVGVLLGVEFTCSHRSETEKSFQFNRVVCFFFGWLIFGTCSVLEWSEGKSRNFIQPHIHGLERATGAGISDLDY